MTYKILYVISSLDKGGAEQQLYYLLKHLKPNATVVSLGGSGYWEAQLKDLGVEVIPLRRRGRADLYRLISLIRIIRDGNFDIVHLFIDNVPGIYVHLAVLLTGHPHLITGERTSVQAHPSWYRMFKRVMNTNVRFVVCNSQASTKSTIDFKLAEASKVKFIANGIELERYSRKAIKSNVITIGTIGGLKSIKNPIMFVNAAAKVIAQEPSVRFIHVGTGELQSEVQALARSLGIEHQITFYGLRNDVPNILREMDIFALSSNVEGMPNALMEAMASGLPAVVTDVGNCKELITHGKNGFVVPPSDVDQFAEALLVLLRDEELRIRMGQLSYERIQSYDVHRMTEQYAELYRETLSNSDA
jgi:glycosyltransferase involved in cell wall biosynthesis